MTGAGSAPTVAILGHRGQDGTFLTTQCRAHGCTVVGVDRAGGEVLPPSSQASAEIRTFTPLDLGSSDAVAAFIETYRPDFLFYLVAHHHSSDEKREGVSDLFAKSFAMHVMGWLHVLEGIKLHAPACRSVYAASSRVFGGVAFGERQNESTRFEPRCAYGITKVAGVELGRTYREQHGLHVSHAFLYNHESELRTPKFLSQRLCHAAVRAASRVGSERAAFKEVVADLSAVTDWGYAPDYVDAMWRMAQVPESSDYVVATGEPHTVADFAREAFAAVGLDYSDHVVEDRSRAFTAQPRRIGDATRLRDKTGWRPSLGFAGLVKRMVQSVQEHAPAEQAKRENHA